MTVEPRGRATWTFAYTLDEVLAAAQARLDHHTEKQVHWIAELTLRKTKLRTEGVDLEAVIRAGAGNSTGYYETPKLNEEMRKAAAEAQERMTYHTDRRDEYATWVRVLTHHLGAGGARGLAVLDCDIADVAFFGL